MSSAWAQFCPFYVDSASSEFSTWVAARVSYCASQNTTKSPPIDPDRPIATISRSLASHVVKCAFSALIVSWFGVASHDPVQNVILFT
jgi:hypothetical protein